METNLMKRLEETFYDYTRQYDQNIKTLIKERGVEISMEELEEILDDAKHMVMNTSNH